MGLDLRSFFPRAQVLKLFIGEDVSFDAHRLEHEAGDLLVISHDRYFLDRVVKRILALDDGQLKEYIGGYSDYAEQVSK